MAKKSSGGGFVIAIVIIFSALSAAYDWAMNNKGWVALIVLSIVAVFVFSQYIKNKNYEERVQELNRKYKNNKDIVNGILSGSFWENQTSEQLIDSRGAPDAIDKKVMKTKTKQIWKYGEIQKGQFRLKITLENEKVIGWEERE